MKIKILITSIMLSAALGFGASVFAQNDGHMDNVWLSARIKTKVKHAVDWTNWPSGPFELIKNIKVDSGKDNCFIHLSWDGLDTYSYTRRSFCLNGNSQWEQVDRGTLYEFIDSQSIGTDWANIVLGLPGGFVRNYPNGYVFAEYNGSFVLTPGFNKQGEVKRVTPTLLKGEMYYYDDATEIGGSSPKGGLHLRNAKDVPPGAVACAAGGDGPLCP
ncbi:MAG: hypothetical protein ACU841_05760 [Gammaproteobacteria bacterium]